MRFAVLFWLLLFAVLPARINAQAPEHTALRTADSLIMSGEPALALPVLQPLLARPATNDSLRGSLYLQYAMCLDGLDRTDSGVYYFNEAAKIWERLANKKNLSRTYANLANALSVNTNYRMSEKHYGLALANAVNRADSLKIFVRLCALYLQHRLIDTAYQVIQSEIIPLGKGSDSNPYTQYFTQLGIGQYFKKHNNLRVAVPALHQAAAAPVGNDKYTANAYALLADAYYKLKNYIAAFRYTDSARFLVGENGWAENRLQIAGLYADLFAATGRADSAYEYAQKARSLYEELYSQDAMEALTETAEKYQNEKLQAQAEAAQRNNQRIEAEKKVAQKNLYLIAIALLFVAVLAFLFFRNARIRRKANEVLAGQKQQVQQLADQLAVANEAKARLFSTIGHDLRSPISSLYASLKMQELKGGTGNESMSEHTVQLLDTLEDLLSWSKSQMEGFVVQEVKVNLPFLLEDLRDFYTTAAEAKGVELSSSAKEKVTVRTDENLLKAILRNAISNAIAHTTKGHVVHLQAEVNTDNAVVISVDNLCSKEDFMRFQDSYEKASVQSGAHGLGIVLMKEFAQKIGAVIELDYSVGSAVLRLIFPASTSNEFQPTLSVNKAATISN